jgi:hypothetical protein
MEENMLGKKAFFALMVLSIFVCGLQIVEPAAAAKAKVIDTGSYSDYDNETNTTLKTAWKTYQYNKNHVVVKFSFYQNGKLMKTSSSITITKVNSKKLKIVSITQGKEINDDGYYSYFYSKNTDYLKYTSTARQFYFDEIKPGLITPP